jgi:hypothetical protein
MGGRLGGKLWDRKNRDRDKINRLRRNQNNYLSNCK